MLRALGIPCDVSVGSANSQFKAHVLASLAAMDARFPALVRAIKVCLFRHPAPRHPHS